MEPGRVGLRHLFQVMTRPNEPVVPCLLQRPLIWGGRGSFDSKPYDQRLAGCSFWVSLRSFSKLHSGLIPM